LTEAIKAVHEDSKAVTVRRASTRSCAEPGAGTARSASLD
jgi:hypothetical protein